ncbi:metallophosphoesterase family protein [Acetivibrio clariflavus]|uniref:DNA repair exonuclease n=1 Tax=Acetivibrio clariflavus (strain DSM 19732 / NBRC 101661 / EBR45) TaxID=720554 RepID=G8LZ20_ACECE|nr:metallophosphoesterase [Acetivibrio clariflavus]AEV68964.1 DNA repair exonuclease [Acetivibrio clariflavus DSM 19732]
MKLLFFTDTHIKGTNPKNRKDNYYETLKRKFREIGDIAKDLEVDYILHGGDWFDRPDISPSIVREFAIIIKNFGKEIYTVAGNHDMYGQNPNTLNRTMLGIFEGTGIVKLLKDDEEIILKKDGISLQLTGKSYNYDIDGQKFAEYYIVKKNSSVDYAINIVHGMLLKKPFYEGIQYTLIDDIKDTEADITFAGHYHSGFGIVEMNGKYFVNPGSIVRISNSIAEIERKPKVVYVELKERVEIREIELKSALPGEEVLDREELERAKDRSVRLHQFYQGISKSMKYKKIDIAGIVENIASNQDLSREVKEEALRRIAIAQESFAMGQDTE